MFSCTWLMAIATEGYNVNRPTQFSVAEVESENCKFGTVSVHCHAHRFASAASYRLLPQICTVRRTKNVIMKVFYCFTVAIGLPGNASDYNEDKRSAVAARMQNKVVVEWGNSESYGVWFWLFGPHGSSCQKIKTMQCVLFYCDLKKQFQHGAFLLSTLPAHLTELSKVFQTVCFDLAQVKTSVELCIRKLSDAAAKSELIANCLIMN